MNKLLYYILIGMALLIPSLSFSQSDSIYFSDDEINGLYEELRTLEISDSLKSIKIGLQEQQLAKYKEIAEYDSLLLLYKDRDISLANEERDIYKRYVNLYKPKWYENKHLWFFLGSGSTLLTGWVFINMNN